jgi:hypothetical protein
MPRKNATALLLIGLPLLVILGAASCVAGPNSVVNTAPPNGAVAGFWMGLWHGIICPITFVISLFKSSSLSFYEIHNNGAWYNFGFLLGFALSVRSGGASARMGQQQRQRQRTEPAAPPPPAATSKG